MHARHFSLHLGRFLSTDPVGGSIGSSQSWSRYAYALNNPLLIVDLFGLTGEDINGTTGGCAQDGPAEDQPCEYSVSSRESLDAALRREQQETQKLLESVRQNVAASDQRFDAILQRIKNAGEGPQLGLFGPSAKDHLSWFGESYYDDMLHRGVVTGGVAVGLSSPLLAGRAGVSLSGGEFHPGVRIGAGQLQAIGVSSFLGAGLKFGSVGRITTRFVITVGSGLAVRVEKLTDTSGASQLRVLVGIGSTRGFVD